MEPAPIPRMNSSNVLLGSELSPLTWIRERDAGVMPNSMRNFLIWSSAVLATPTNGFCIGKPDFGLGMTRPCF
jgi:hypothetical protein